MRSSRVILKDALFGENLTWSGVSLVIGFVLGVAVWVSMPMLSKDAGIPTARLWALPGLLFIIVVPPIVGYIFWRNKGIIPTLLISYLPVFAFYRFLRFHPEYIGAIGIPSAINRPEVYNFSVFYWVIGVGSAFALRYFYDNRWRTAG